MLQGFLSCTSLIVQRRPTTSGDGEIPLEQLEEEEEQFPKLELEEQERLPAQAHAREATTRERT